MENLIPKPVSMIPGKGVYELTHSSQIIIEPVSDEMLALGQYLASCLQPATGFNLRVGAGEDTLPAGFLHLTTQNTDPELGQEGYELTATPLGIRISGHTPEGIFRGIQTLRQLFPAAVESSTQQTGPWQIPAGFIRDKPRFAYRGTMLDVSRHFFGPTELKRYMDLLAYYKINVLHLHLSDDQGWRIEIKSWPNLTAHGSQSAVNGDPGGFYSQEEYEDLVAYASSRYITIVPEIDLPGHTNAALSSYPDLNCDGQAPPLYTGMEVGFSSLCINKEITYQFVDDVVRELAALTPGPYIHIGGDEAHSTSKTDYRYFIERIEPIVRKYGKRMVGWEEIVNCDLSPSSVAQYWTDVGNAETAVDKGVRLIISPAPRAYLDMKYHAETELGLDWAGLVSVETAYSWDPVSEVRGLDENMIVGVEAPLWSETLRTMQDVEFMAFPRLPGIAEIGWSPAGGRAWDEYRQRLAEQGSRWAVMGVNYYRAPEIPW
jgi:hexosaminidase